MHSHSNDVIVCRGCDSEWDNDGTQFEPYSEILYGWDVTMEEGVSAVLDLRGAGFLVPGQVASIQFLDHDASELST